MNPLLLVLIFELKHFVCDFLLQFEYHLGKFKKTGWEIPLASHCAVHAAFTFLILMAVRPEMWWLALVDFVIHFIMDRVKASPSLLGRFKSLDARCYLYFKGMQERHKEVPNIQKECAEVFTSNRNFWWCLGFDQLVHQLTGLLVIWIISSK